ncbi:hypothetical protein HpSP79_00200 [Helicobacter pylori]
MPTLNAQAAVEAWDAENLNHHGNMMAEDFTAKLSPVLNTVGYIGGNLQKEIAH